MAGVKYYLRQANAFLSHAQSITDTQLKARYRMMAQQYSDMASESAGEPEGSRVRIERPARTAAEFTLTPTAQIPFQIPPRWPRTGCSSPRPRSGHGARHLRDIG